MFRVTDELRAALARRFVSRWAFDVELLGRLLRSPGYEARSVELPLRVWRARWLEDDAVGQAAAADLVRIRAALRSAAPPQ